PGRDIRAGPERKKTGVEYAAVAKQLAAIIGANRVGEEGPQRRRAARRDGGLVHAVIRRAEQAHVAVRPGLLRRPGDAGEMIVDLLLAQPGLQAALRTADPTGRHDR